MYRLTRPVHGQISASIMCADLLNLGSALCEMERQGIEYLHIDIMDGCFVPNYTLGTDTVARLRKATGIRLDLHLMITEPERKLDWFDIRDGDIVSFHCEATNHIERTMQYIRERGAIPFPALNPATPLCFLDYIVEEAGGVLIMTVNPGYAGQKLIPQTISKIATLRRTYPDLPIEADGNVTPPNAALMRAAGADIFVAGSSGMFIPNRPLSDTVPMLRLALD